MSPCPDPNSHALSGFGRESPDDARSHAISAPHVLAQRKGRGKERGGIEKQPKGKREGDGGTQKQGNYVWSSYTSEAADDWGW